MMSLSPAAFCTRAYKNCPRSVFSLCLECLHTTMAHRSICMSDNWLQESAVKDSLFVFGGNSLGVQTFAPSSLVLTPSTPFVHFIFHACSFASLPLHPPVSPSPPLAVSALRPRPPPLFSIPLVLDRCKSRAFCCKGWYFWSQVTHTFMFQAAMTVTDMYIMLSDSVRHASSLLLFIWKLFNVLGPCVVETYSDSFLYHDALFAGVDTLLHMNMKYLADALIQSDLQRACSMGGLSVSCSTELQSIIAAAGVDPVTLWMLNCIQYALRKTAQQQWEAL